MSLVHQDQQVRVRKTARTSDTQFSVSVTFNTTNCLSGDSPFSH